MEGFQWGRGMKKMRPTFEDRRLEGAEVERAGPTVEAGASLKPSDRNT